MSVQLNYAVVHELVKETGTTEANVVLAETLLSAEDRVVGELVSQDRGTHRPEREHGALRCVPRRPCEHAGSEHSEELLYGDRANLRWFSGTDEGLHDCSSR